VMIGKRECCAQARVGLCIRRVIVSTWNYHSIKAK
jgi:hypothetical protein